MDKPRNEPWRGTSEDDHLTDREMHRWRSTWAPEQDRGRGRGVGPRPWANPPLTMGGDMAFVPGHHPGAERPPRERHEDEGRPDSRSSTRGRSARWWQREPLTAGEIMTRDVEAVGLGSSVTEIARLMKKENVGVVPVVDGDRRLVGLITDRDLVLRVLAGEPGMREERAEHLMTTDVAAVSPHASVRQVVEIMGRKLVRRVPIIDEGRRLMGVVSLSDIATRADYDEDLQDALGRLSSRRSFWSRPWR